MSSRVRGFAVVDAPSTCTEPSVESLTTAVQAVRANGAPSRLPFTGGELR